MSFNRWARRNRQRGLPAAAERAVDADQRGGGRGLRLHRRVLAVRGLPFGVQYHQEVRRAGAKAQPRKPRRFLRMAAGGDGLPFGRLRVARVAAERAFGTFSAMSLMRRICGGATPGYSEIGSRKIDSTPAKRGRSMKKAEMFIE